MTVVSYRLNLRAHACFLRRIHHAPGPLGLVVYLCDGYASFGEDVEIVEDIGDVMVAEHVANEAQVHRRPE